MSSERGYTLIELMLTIGVAAILLSMAVPAMQMFSSNARQTSSINEFVGSMHLSRSTAITTNARVTMCASSDGATCDEAGWENGWILFRDPNSSRTVDGDEKIIGAVGDSPRLAIASSQYNSFLVYRPNGRVMGSTVAQNTGEVTFCDDRGSDHSKVIVVEMSGRPRVSKTTRLGAAPTCS